MVIYILDVCESSVYWPPKNSPKQPIRFPVSTITRNSHSGVFSSGLIVNVFTIHTYEYIVYRLSYGCYQLHCWSHIGYLVHLYSSPLPVATLYYICNRWQRILIVSHASLHPSGVQTLL